MSNINNLATLWNPFCFTGILAPSWEFNGEEMIFRAHDAGDELTEELNDMHGYIT